MAEEKDLKEEIEENEDEEEVEPWPAADDEENWDDDEEDEDDEDEDDDEEDEDDWDDEEGGVDDGDGIEEDAEEHLSREEFDEQVLAPEGIRPMSQRGIDMWEEYNNQF